VTCTCKRHVTAERDAARRGRTGSCEVREAFDLYRAFNQFGPSRVVRLRHRRVMPAVVLELGKLVGLIYRSDKWQAGRPRTFIHFMEEPPRLVSNAAGTQLYVVGGNYRITQRGIEG
jgi:hypothetical protein